MVTLSSGDQEICDQTGLRLLYYVEFDPLCATQQLWLPPRRNTGIEVETKGALVARLLKLLMVRDGPCHTSG